jgi:hypothetical protein
MATSGPGIFFDGATSARRGVSVELALGVLRIRAVDGTVLAEWPYDRLETVSAPRGSCAWARPQPRAGGLESATRLAAAIDGARRRSTAAADACGTCRSR